MSEWLSSILITFGIIALIFSALIVGYAIVTHYHPPTPICHHVFNEVKTFKNTTHIEIYRCLDDIERD
jgi:hypothetical protein